MFEMGTNKGYMLKVYLKFLGARVRVAPRKPRIDQPLYINAPYTTQESNDIYDLDVLPFFQRLV